MSVYSDYILGRSGTVLFDAIGESSGIVATDSKSGLNGTYQPNSGGTWTGGTLGQPGIPGMGGATAAKTNGTGGYVEHADNAALRFGTGDFTASCWFVADTVVYGSAAEGALISKDYTGFELYVYQGVINAYVGGTGNPANGTTPITTGSLYHALLTRNSGVVKTYLNGVAEATSANTANVSAVGQPLRIGQRGSGGSLTLYKGTIGAVTIVSRGLSPAEAATEYATGLTAASLLLRRRRCA